MSWVDDLRKAEPNTDQVNTDAVEEAMVQAFETVDDVWDQVHWEQDYENPGEVGDTGFRIPLREGDRPSCLGKTVALSMYSEFDGGHDVSIKVQYDDVFDHEDGSFALQGIPHVATNVDGVDYGLMDYENTDELPVEAVADLYRIGLGTEVLNEDQDIGVSYDDLISWGESIENEYSGSTPGPSSSYMARQGSMMKQEAEEEKLKEDSGFDYIA